MTGTVLFNGTAGLPPTAVCLMALHYSGCCGSATVADPTLSPCYLFSGINSAAVFYPHQRPFVRGGWNIRAVLSEMFYGKAIS